MVRGLGRAAALAALLLGTYGAAGCNAVLGIEQAELDTTTTSTPSKAVCNASQGVQLAACRPATGIQDACESCVNTKCKGVPNANINNANYRGALAAYRSCQRAECTDDGSCAACLQAEPSAACVAGCAKECQTAEVFEWCDAYCLCMDQTCPAPSYHTKDGAPVTPSGGLDACHTKCVAEDIWRVNCLLTHCELAATNGQNHCRHADDTNFTCSKEPPSASLCTDGTQRQLGYPCTVDRECCSGSCNDAATGGSCIP